MEKRAPGVLQIGKRYGEIDHAVMITLCMTMFEFSGEYFQGEEVAEIMAAWIAKCRIRREDGNLLLECVMESNKCLK